MRSLTVPIQRGPRPITPAEKKLSGTLYGLARLEMTGSGREMDMPRPVIGPCQVDERVQGFASTREHAI